MRPSVIWIRINLHINFQKKLLSIQNEPHRLTFSIWFSLKSGEAAIYRVKEWLIVGYAKGSLFSKSNWFLAIKNLILHFWPKFSILECFILKIWILAHFFILKKCAKIQIFKMKHSRIENLGQKWRMRFFMAKN